MLNITMEQNCALCHATLSCQSEITTSKCWCFELPNIMPINSKQSDNPCLCKNCLAKKINKQITSLYLIKNLAQMIEIAKPYREKKDLVEHIDYSIENGLYVFSAWYHLKRGKCCSNGCRHCPYNKRE
ncbi:cysteine-rich CWC family protein [Pseudoalteromonas denitrificans]|nr:cysteine-rich CWC family protein [Pseudoalteromonas denitrificans]